MTHDDRRDAIQKLVPIALSKAQEMAWEDVSLWDLCADTDISLSDCARLRINKEAVVDALYASLDVVMLDHVEAPDMTQNVRDRLFDALMGRFDALEENRSAWRSIVLSGTNDPLQEVARRARRARSGAWALEAAGVSASSLAGAGRAIGIASILRRCEAVWLEDGPDLAKTMARLDQELRKGEQIVTRLNEVSRFMSGFSRKPNKRPSFAEAVPD
jgi:hypothetical protein